MAVAKSFQVMILLLSATIALSSCAKKDSEFKGRKNASGARYVGDQAQAAAADQSALANGLTTLDITKTAHPVASGPGTVTITSEVVINEYFYDISTSHSRINMPATASEDIGGIQMTATAVCTTMDCNPYYLMLTFKKGNQEIQQKVLKKHFAYIDEASQYDYIVARAPGSFFPTIDAAISYINQGIAEQPQDGEE